MKISDFQYEFPDDLIALEPSRPASAARLMAYDRKTKIIQHKNFTDLPELLQPGDCLVVNNTKVIPARFFAQRLTGADLEGLFISQTDRGVLVWLKGKVNEGETIQVKDFGEVKVLWRHEVRAELECNGDDFQKYLWECGEIPLPPYIRQKRLKSGMVETHKDDSVSYQTCFARESDRHSVASPTASLHFDTELMEALKEKGIELLEVNLQVGEGTFAPVRGDDLSGHKMHTESVQIEAETWKKLKRIKEEGRRIIAVGTTAVRSLESAYLREQKGESLESFQTDLFIKPPFEFKMVDALITNFHWPDSTLIVLVATFMEAVKGKCSSEINHQWRVPYETAIDLDYRLFSYGDGMFIQ